MPVRKAIIPAAGLGTRFLPATKAQPKEMLTLVDKPAIQYVMEEAVAAGITEVLIITGRGKRAIEDHFDATPDLDALLERKGMAGALDSLRQLQGACRVYYTRQGEPLGLGHAVACGRAFAGGAPVAVLLGDDLFAGPQPCLQQLLARFDQTGLPCVAVEQVPPAAVSRYGIIRPEPGPGPWHRVRDLVEKPAPDRAPSNLAVVGRYVLPPEVFDILDATAPGAGGEIQLTDALRRLCGTTGLGALEVQGRHWDVGDKLGFLQATVELALAHPELGAPFRDYLVALFPAAAQAAAARQPDRP